MADSLEFKPPPIPMNGQHLAPQPSLAREVTKEEITQVRALMGDQKTSPSDHLVVLFVRATGGNLPLSAKRLNATLAWRAAIKPESVVCKACARDSRAHYMHLVGYDLKQRPIIYSCLAAASNKVYKDNLDHMIQTFEMAINCMEPGVDAWTWVCDFHGFGMGDLNPRLAKAFLDMTAEHYPERLGLFVIVDAPSLFGVLWKAISQFVDPKTYTKIRFVPFDPNAPKSQLRECLKSACDEDTSKWLVNEMVENRDAKKLKAKLYSMKDIHHSASAGNLLASSPDDAHDHRGSKALLRTYSMLPSVLQPQASTLAD